MRAAPCGVAPPAPSHLSLPPSSFFFPRARAAQADKAGLPCFTETSDAAKLLALQGAGFESVGTTDIFGVTAHLLLRKARL